MGQAMSGVVGFGNPECSRCGQRHPIGFDCAAAEQRANETMLRAIARSQSHMKGGPMQIDKPEPTDADGEVLAEMRAQIWAAGATLEDSEFIARMLWRNGRVLVPIKPTEKMLEELARIGDGPEISGAEVWGYMLAAAVGCNNS